jgi:hypothetical protein
VGDVVEVRRLLDVIVLRAFPREPRFPKYLLNSCVNNGWPLFTKFHKKNSIVGNSP